MEPEIWRTKSCWGFHVTSTFKDAIGPHEECREHTACGDMRADLEIVTTVKQRERRHRRNKIHRNLALRRRGEKLGSSKKFHDHDKVGISRGSRSAVARQVSRDRRKLRGLAAMHRLPSACSSCRSAQTCISAASVARSTHLGLSVRRIHSVLVPSEMEARRKRDARMRKFRLTGSAALKTPPRLCS